VRPIVAVLAVAWGLGLPATAIAQSATRGLSAEQFNVSLTLLDDGSIDVRETIVFRFTGRTFSEVERDIPLTRLDGIIDVRASLDGQLLPPGRDASSRRRASAEPCCFPATAAARTGAAWHPIPSGRSRCWR
jgi:hypothetical protein